jgi:hypothetical protein
MAVPANGGRRVNMPGAGAPRTAFVLLRNQLAQPAHQAGSITQNRAFVRPFPPLP